MTENEAVDAVIAWAESVLPELGEPKRAPDSSWPLPSAACSLRRTALQAGPVEQAVEYRREAILIVAVHPEPQDAAESTRYEFAQRLMDGLKNDTTLGGRARVHVPRDEPICTVDYDVEATSLDDGATASAVALSFALRDVA